jgi:predicted N-acetyltransferase YhbS
VSTTDRITFRTLSNSDVEAAHRLSVAVGWPHRAEDWRAVLSVGHGCCALDAMGRVVGTAMWWPMGADFATLGMVIVSPELQGRGLGRKLMRAVLESAPYATLQLNATAAGLSLYRSEGFRPIGTVEQYQGVALPVTPKRPSSEVVRSTTEADWPSVIALDRLGHGHDREAILAGLTRQAAGVLCLRDGRAAGYAFCRPFGRGAAIGPVIAADEQTAIALIASLVSSRTGEFLRIDVPVGHTDLARLLEASGLLPAGRVTTMIKGRRKRPSSSAKAFALVNQAIG